MPDEASVRYSLGEPFERAVGLVSDALRSHGLNVVGQMDVSKRLVGSLGIGLAPCRILFVLPQPAGLPADTIHLWAAAFLPLHIVISGGEHRSEIDIENTVRPEGAAAPTVYGPLTDVQRRVSNAIEAIAARPSIMA